MGTGSGGGAGVAQAGRAVGRGWFLGGSGAARELDHRRRPGRLRPRAAAGRPSLRTLPNVPNVLALPHLGYATRRNCEGRF